MLMGSPDLLPIKVLFTRSAIPATMQVFTHHALPHTGKAWLSRSQGFSFWFYADSSYSLSITSGNRQNSLWGSEADAHSNNTYYLHSSDKLILLKVNFQGEAQIIVPDRLSGTGFGNHNHF